MMLMGKHQTNLQNHPNQMILGRTLTQVSRMPEDKEIVFDLDTLRKQLLSSEMPVHIEVSKNSKGYNYSVSYHGKNPEECLNTVLRLTDILKDKFEK